MALLWVLVGLLLILLLCLAASTPITKRHKIKIKNKPEDFGLKCEDIEFVTSDNIRLNGWWIPAEDSSRTIIFLHGFAGSMDPDVIYAPWFHDLKFNVLMFDFRAHSRSGGRISTIGALEVRDVAAAVEFAKQHGSLQIGLLGFSMGGRAAILYAASHDEISAVISDGGPLRLCTAIKEGVKEKGVSPFLAGMYSFMAITGASLLAGINLFTKDPIRVAGKLGEIPLMLIHGEEDAYAHSEEIMFFMKETGENVSLWSVPDAGHRNVDQVHPEEYKQHITDFFEHYMSSNIL